MYDVKSDTVVEIWSAILQELKTKLDINAYSTFFEPLVPVGIIDGKLKLEAPSRFVKEVISSPMFTVQINECLKKITDQCYEIEIKEKDEIEVKVEAPIVKKQIEDSFTYRGNLNPEFTFTNFVVGPCNRECYEAALAVAMNPGTFYNPLFIYGRAGIGKTHLLHAIGNYCETNSKRKLNVYYTTASEFIDEFMRSSQTKEIDAMKNKFRSIDLLLLDDVQFLAGKEKTGEVFFHIFNNLFNEKKQIVLTSDRNPNDLRGLEARLVSRFASGLTVGMSAPEHETAKAILRRKIDVSSFDVKNIDDDVLVFIAQNFSSDVRQLEGALNRLFFYVRVHTPETITLPFAMEALLKIMPNKAFKTPGVTTTVSEIKNTICDYYNITKEQLVGKTRTSSVTNPRFIAIYLCRILLNMTYEEIGKEFGNRDHTTILNACTKIEELEKTNQAFKLAINNFKQMLTKK